MWSVHVLVHAFIHITNMGSLFIASNGTAYSRSLKYYVDSCQIHPFLLLEFVAQHTAHAHHRSSPLSVRMVAWGADFLNYAYMLIVYITSMNIVY